MPESCNHIKLLDLTSKNKLVFQAPSVKAADHASRSLHEVRNLTVRDVISSKNDQFKGRKALRVILHEDINPDGNMKANARVRSVLLHENLLLPKIEEFLKAGLNGTSFLFPALWRTRGKEQWCKDSLRYS